MRSLLGLCPKVLKTVEIGYTAGAAGIEIHDVQDLEQKLADFMQYYNLNRVDQSPGGDTPAVVNGEFQPLRAGLRAYSRISHCNKHFQTPIAA